jgi:CHASE2 domain-containing sensor protein
MADATDALDRTSRSGLWLTVMLAVLAAVLGSFNGLGRVDQILYDRAVTLTGRPADPDILIVAIDDTSIDTLGRWPWRRAIHAAILDRLQGARAVGLDLIFAESDTVNPNDDLILANSIRRNGKTVLPIVLDRLNHPSAIGAPIPGLANAAAGSGFINARIDPDGVVREATLMTHYASDRQYHLAISMLEVGGQSEQAQRLLQRAGPDGTILIPYSGSTAHMRTVSYLSVLRGEVSPDELRGKYVLVGAWATGLGDAYPTPVWRSSPTCCKRRATTFHTSAPPRLGTRCSPPCPCCWPAWRCGACHPSARCLSALRCSPASCSCRGCCWLTPICGLRRPRP